MNLNDRDSKVTQGLIDDVLHCITDIESVNDSVKKYVDNLTDNEEGTPVNEMTESAQEHHFELTALRTKEIIIAALAQL